MQPIDQVVEYLFHQKQRHILGDQTLEVNTEKKRMPRTTYSYS